jgi:hypothetical protein
MSIFKRARLYITRKRGGASCCLHNASDVRVCDAGPAVKHSATKESAAIRKSLCRQLQDRDEF